MYILLIAATAIEIQPTIHFLERREYTIENNSWEVQICGVGAVSTTYLLTSHIYKHRPDYIVQAGTAGTFTINLPLSEVVLIKEEIMGDLGVEENGDFKDVFDLNLAEPSSPPFNNKRLVNPYIKDWEKYKIPLVNGLSVNEVTTSPARIDLLMRKYNCDIESMEGAAFNYVCLQEKIPFIQFRSISNAVGERDKMKWKLREAIQKLNDKLIDIILQLPKA